LIIDNKRIIFDTYHKTTFSGRFLNFYSNHPLCHKKDIIINFVDKIFLLSYSRIQYNNLVEVFIFFLIMVIFSLLFFPQLKMIKISHTYKHNPHNIIHTIHKSKKNFLVPDVKSIFESFLLIFNMFHCKLAFSITNILKSFIKRGKDKLELLSNQNVVYKISYDDCEASYVGQTKRKLSTRIREHISYINKKTGSPSFLTV